MRDGGSQATNAYAATRVHRRRLFDALASPANFVAVVGPIGAGATTLLREWAHDQNATWVVPAHSFLETVTDLLIIDDAGELDESEWERIWTLSRERPELRVRAAVHSRSAIPDGHGVEFVHDLLFTPHETAEYLAAHSSALNADEVFLLTGGLPAAVKTLAEAQSVRPTLVKEALARISPGALPPEQQRLAHPQVLTVEVVTSLGFSADVLESAERQGFGSWVIGVGHPLFMLTAPVRYATLRRAGVHVAQQVRAEAAQVLLAQGAWLGAIIEGAASGSLETVDAALRGGGMQLILQHPALLFRVLGSIRMYDLRAWPIIAFALALLLNARKEQRLRAVELFGLALVGARRAAATRAERALLRTIESVLQRLLGLGDGGVRAARAAAKITDEFTDDERQPMEGLLGDLHLHAAISLMHSGHGDEAIVQFERAKSSSSRPGVQLGSYGGIACIHALSGDLREAQGWIDLALERPWPAEMMRGYQGSLLHMAQAKVHLEANELDAADAALDTVWHMLDTVEHWPVLVHVRAMVDLCRGDAAAGLEKVRAVRRRRGTRMPKSLARLLDVTESSLALAAGEVSSVRKLRMHPQDLPAVTIGVARAEFVAGQHELVLRTLSRVVTDEPEPRASAAALEAVSLFRVGQKAESMIAARRARTISETYGLHTPFVLFSDADRELLGVHVPWDAPRSEAAAVMPELTERERVVLRSLADTGSFDEIARRLHVSPNTVKSQRRTLYRKLGATSREDALAIGMAHGLLHELHEGTSAQTNSPPESVS